MNDQDIILETRIVAALEALEGMRSRVCPVVDIKKSTGPLCVFEQRQDEDEQMLSGDAGLLTAVYQIHVLHNTYMQMRLLAGSVKQALKALQGYRGGSLTIESVTVQLGSPDILENKVQLFRRTYNVTIFYQIKEE